MQISKLRLSEAELVGKDPLQVSDDSGLMSELSDPNSFHDSGESTG